MSWMWERLKSLCRIFMRQVSRMIDNMRLRKKMLLMFIVCVLIPLIATDSILLSAVYRAEKERRRYEILNTAASVENCLDNMVSYMTTASVSLYTNSDLYSFLDKQYKNPEEYFTSFNNMSNLIHNVLFGANTYVNTLRIYTDNDTISGGGGVQKLSSVRNEDWYRYVCESGRGMNVFCHMEDNNSAPYRTISFIEKLNFPKHNTLDEFSKERMLRLTLNYSYFMNILRQQRYDADVYICDGGRVLFSTVEKTVGQGDFLPLDTIDVSKAVYSSDYPIFGQKWKIYIYESAGSDFGLKNVIKENAGLLITLIVLNLLLPFAAVYLIDRSISRRIILLGEHLNMVDQDCYEKMASYGAADEIGELIRDYNRMAAKMEKLINEGYKVQVRQQEDDIARQRAELLALHSQINPHVLFTALESIRMRSLIRHANETAEAIELLAVLMRKSTDWYDDMVPLSDESSFAEAYLKLQQYRFGSRLGYSINIDPECRKLLLPKLTLVTFVENACVHGVESIARDCMIILSAELDYDDEGQKMLTMYIEDTGGGMDEEKCAEIISQMRDGNMESLLNSRSVGIINACLRLRRCFGEDITFDADSEPNVGTCITIRIPADRLSAAESDRKKIQQEKENPQC